MKIRNCVKFSKFNNAASKILAGFVLLGISVSMVGCGDLSGEGSNSANSSIATVSEEINNDSKDNVAATQSESETEINLTAVPKFDDEPYVALENNQPDFSESEITKKSFENYSKLDSLGRCGVALACVGKDIMPTEKRGSIGMVKPTGWHTVKYDFVDGKYLYNRCHLIGYQLTGENANERNLITGTRYMNVEGMLPFEDMVADYVKETDNHVLYRVTPVYQGNNLVASGVQIEGYSVEDQGKGISFNVYCYNVQPGVKIDYKTGNSSSTGKVVEETTQKKKTVTKETTEKKQTVSKKDSSSASVGSTEYVLNLNTHKFHYPDCKSVKIMSAVNKGTYTGSREDLIQQGYEPCGNCNP